MFKLSEFLSMDPFGKHGSHSFTFPLWGHVSNTMNSSEGQTIIVFYISLNLSAALNEPRSILFSSFPSQSSDPLPSSVGWNSTISITRVEEDLIFVSQDGINPEGGFSLGLISQSIRALFPSW